MLGILKNVGKMVLGVTMTGFACYEVVEGVKMVRNAETGIESECQKLAQKKKAKTEAETVDVAE